MTRHLKLTALALAGAGLCAVSAQAANVTVNANADLYNAGVVNQDGTAAVAIDVTGLSAITFSVSTGATITFNNGNYNDADGVGSVSDSFNTGANAISGMTAYTTGYLAGVFLGATSGATPTALGYADTASTAFTQASPLLQQSFFIGDGLTGDATGTTQTFYVPTGATTLYLGFSDACGYHGSPSCYGDNVGSLNVSTAGVAAVPEPSMYALMAVGLAGLAFTVRRRKQALTD